MRQFIGGFVVATLIVGGAGAWLVKRVDDQPIRWPSPTFYDQAGVVPEAGYLHVSGSLIGEDMNGSTFLDVTCDGETKVCRVNELQQFGPYRQVSLWTDEYAITSWSKDQMVAESSPPPTACNRVRMVLDRVAKVTHYYRIPNPKADREKCAAISSQNKVFDWTLGDQPI
jgi:hypothetical protein